MGKRDDRTDRFRTIFEPEDIFERFVKNANVSVDEGLPDDDDVTSCISRDAMQKKRAKRPTGISEQTTKEYPREGLAGARRGGPPTWDHQITVVASEPGEDAGATSDETTAVGPPPDAEAEGTRPDAPMTSAGSRAMAEDPDPTEEMRHDEITVKAAVPGVTDSGQRILLLTRVKQPSIQEQITPVVPHEVDPLTSSSWQSVIAPRGLYMQQLEAMRVVPDVEAAAKKGSTVPIGESADDGQMPTRQLDQILSDMAVLLRYGHEAQVRERLEQLRRTYPEDLLLLRAIAEFHVAHEQMEAALDTLFALAGGLFERRNVEGMRQALEQVLVLDPKNARAFRLLGLLEKRPHGTGD